MTETEKVALALEPLSESFGQVPLMAILSEYECFPTLLEARDFILDLAAVAPQVVWVESKSMNAFEKALADLEIVSQVVTSDEAARITAENKPVRGTIDFAIRTRNHEIDTEMIRELKARKLSSGYRVAGNANEIFHWKDDRWFQDFYLTIFDEADIPAVVNLIENFGYLPVPPEEQNRS